ncbi:MAG: protein kinase [Myxococcales bacterium]|nr:protein kinase [Myxococcales bacterium]
MSYQPGQKSAAETPQSDAPDVPFPSLGGRYRAVKELGHGGMGRVFVAHDLKLDRDVAIKVLNAGEQDEYALLRFEQEGRAAAALNHPNILDVHDIGSDDGSPYIVYELLEGDTLRKRVEGGPLPPRVAVDYALQLARGLVAAHAKGVIHRDLKPENLFITAEGRLKILDFGVAKLLPGAATDPGLRTATGALIGTADYMSPEQVRTIPVDQRSDVFSFGTILCEMLTGARPFNGRSLMEVGYSIISAEPAIPPSLPADLAAIVRRCLEKDREKRFQSAGELVAALEDAARGLTPPPSLRKRLLRASALVVAAAAAVIAAKLIPIGRRYAGPPAAPRPVTMLIADFDNATGEPVFDGTLEPVLTLAMEGASFVNAYRVQDARRIAAELKPGTTRLDESTARLVAVREGIGVVISGSIARKDEGYAVSARAVAPLDGKTIVDERAEASAKTDVLPLLGRLAGSIRGALGDTAPQLGLQESFSAGSLDAAHEYAAAQALQHRGDNEGALAHYKKAVELDPDLGRAWSGMAAVSMNLHQREQAEKYFQLAMARIDRMTARERYRTRGLYYLFQRDYEKAADEYGALVKQYPADLVGFLNLAVAHCYRRDMAAALEVGRQALALAPNHVMNRSNLAVYAMYSGDFNRAATEARAVQQASPAYTTPRVVIALSELANGHADKAAVEYAALAWMGKSGPTLSGQGFADLALFEGRVSDAAAILERRIAEDATASPSAAANELLTLASAELSRRRPALAVAAADRAVGLSKSDATAFLAGRIYLETGNEKKVRALQADLASRRAREPQAYAAILEGEDLLRRGDARAAVRALRRAQELLDTWIGRFVLARAWLESGAFPEAHEELETCLKRRGEATALFVDEVPTLRYLPAVHYWLGRAQEGLHSPAAAASYRTFLSFKEKADAGADPLVEDARRRVAGK